MRSSSIVELKKRLEAESNKNNSQTFERTQELKQYAQARKTATQSEVITSDVNAQISERQKELAQIAAARRLAAHEILPKEEKGQDIKSNSAASEFKNNIKVSDLRNQLVNKIHFSPVINTQKSIIDEDMKSLLNTGTHVLEKARELDRLLIFGSKKAIDTLKANEVSTKAKIELTLKPDLKIFEELQETMISHLQEKLKADFSEYTRITQSSSVSKEKFLQLSFIYRSYQVCLEQDVFRHIAKYIPHHPNNVNAIPSNLAIQSLNYYEDFFQNLVDIEKLWPDAGKEIRKDEMAILFAAKFYMDMQVFAGMLNHNAADCQKFNEAFAIYIKRTNTIEAYIQLGKGLDKDNHPWRINGYVRLPQANSSINFKEIVAMDEAHENALKDVGERVENDHNRKKF